MSQDFAQRAAHLAGGINAECKNAALRFLVADDNQDTADSLASLLRHEGFDVRVAYDGRTALETAVSFLPDVLVLDIRMPNIDGLQLAHRLRGMPQFEGKVFVAHSGYAQQEDLDQASRADFDEYLVKPCSLRTLRAIVDEAFERLESSRVRPPDADAPGKQRPR